MNCLAIQKQILSHLDGELHGEMAYDFEQHIKNCITCQKEVDRLKIVNHIIDSEKEEFNIDPFMSTRILAKLSKNKVSATKQIITMRYLAISSLAAAGLMIGIIIGTLFSTVNASSEISSTEQEWEQLADEYMPEVDNNPYNIVAISTNETPKKP